MLVATQAVLLLVLVAKSECDSPCSSHSKLFSCESGQPESSEESSENKSSPEGDNSPRTHLPSCPNCISGVAQPYLAERDGFVSVDCGKCSIVKLDVRAWKDTRCDPKVCWGLTLELFSSSKNCMWKNNCILSYSPSLIMWSPPDQPSCIGEVPRILDVDFSCLHSGAAIDDLLKGYQIIEKEKGRVHLHSGSHDPTHTTLNRYIMDITPPANLRESWKNYFVMLYVMGAHFTAEEILTLRDPSRFDSSEDLGEGYDTTSWRKKDIHTLNCSTLRFHFRVNDSLNINSNFDLCFQWFDQYNRTTKKLFNKTIKHCKQAKDNKQSKINRFYIIKNRTTHHKGGIIRSHARHPWNYPRPILPQTHHIFHKSRWHIHVLQAPVGLPYLTVEASQIDLGRGDVLFISSDTHKGEQLKQPGQYYISGDRVTLNFSILYSTAHTNPGFLLCYEWSQYRDMSGSKRPCENFVYRINHCGKEGLGEACRLPGTRRRTARGNRGITMRYGNETSVTQRPTSASRNRGNKTQGTAQRKKAVIGKP